MIRRGIMCARGGVMRYFTRASWTSVIGYQDVIFPTPVLALPMNARTSTTSSADFGLGAKTAQVWSNGMTGLTM